MLCNFGISFDVNIKLKIWNVVVVVVYVDLFVFVKFG